MCGELDIADFRSFPGIDERQPTAAVADDDIPGAPVYADIVGVTAQREAAGEREIFAAEKPDRAIAGAGESHEIRFLRIAHRRRPARADIRCRFGAGDPNLVDTTVIGAFGAQRCIDCSGVEINGWWRSGRRPGNSAERRLAFGERGVQRGS